ncbi:MAG: hypothetical protein KA354_19785 [Phycisphaerae bacterium]|nr:hypothetical protein [Phycisphaerae bacterium]
MGLPQALLSAVGSLVAQGLDILSFFVIVRLITLYWRLRPLLAFDRVGQPLVDPILSAVQRVIPMEWASREPQRTRLVAAVALLAVAVCRLALRGAAYVLIVP